MATYFRLKALTFHYPKNPQTRIVTGFFHSHSIVPGGFEVMSYTTRLTPGTSFETAYLRAFRHFPRWNFRCRETWTARAPSPKVMGKNAVSSGVLAVGSGFLLMGSTPHIFLCEWLRCSILIISYRREYKQKFPLYIF